MAAEVQRQLTAGCEPASLKRRMMSMIKLEKNPLLRARRRRGDANVVWEFPPVEKKMLAKFRAALREILEEAPQG